MDLMLRAENLDAGLGVNNNNAVVTATTTTTKHDYSFNDDNTFDEGLLMGDNSLMEDVRAAVATESEKENAGRARSSKKRRRKRGLTPSVKTNMINEDVSGGIKKKQKRIENNDVAEETIVSSEPTKYKMREVATSGGDEIRPAILSQAPEDDGDNPECAQQ